MYQPSSRPPLRAHLVVSALSILLILGGVLAVRPPILRSAAHENFNHLAYLPLIAKLDSSAPPTATVVTTHTATATSTAAATSTATSTATPTPVPPCNSVYPIAIYAGLLDARGFIPPTNASELAYYGIYNDGTYTNKTQRRIFQRLPSDYYFLAWRQGGGSDVTAFNAAITGTGTLYQGFDEVVPWPDPNSPGPYGYPLYPHQLTVSDWVLVFQGAANTAQAHAAFDNHIIRRTVLALPIYDKMVGNGSSASVHVIRLGTFLLRGYGVSGGQPFLDLVYLGDAAPLNCDTVATATPVDSSTVTPSFATVTATPSETPTPSPTVTTTL